MDVLLLFLILKFFIMFKGLCSIDITKPLVNLLKNFEESTLTSPDAYFGIAIAEGLISGFQNERNQCTSSISKFGSILFEKVTQLKNKNTIQDIESLPVYKEIIFKNIMSSRWNFTTKPVYNILPKISSILLWENYLQTVDDGNLSRHLSDQCLAQILATKSCSINIQCIQLFQQQESYGYHKTHQILIALLMTKNKCNSWIPFSTTMRFTLSVLCSQIYREVLTIYLAGIPKDFRDLFLEQVLLCGISGFTEFFNKSFIIHILSWQNSNGCFPSNINEVKRFKENYNCQNHMTGLGIAFLSNLARNAAIP